MHNRTSSYACPGRVSDFACLLPKRHERIPTAKHEQYSPLEYQRFHDVRNDPGLISWNPADVSHTNTRGYLYLSARIKSMYNDKLESAREKIHCSTP